MTDSTLHWLLLQHLLDFSASTLRRLALEGTLGSSPEAWLQAPAPQLRAAGLSARQCAPILAWQRRRERSPAHAQACRQRDWLEANGVRLLALTDPDYPPLLLEIADPPPLLFVAGAVECLSRPQLAVVGSRSATRQGLTDAGWFAQQLATAGFVITSGMAYGIDAAAHEATLAAGCQTVAVFGCGIDVIYPSAHGGLAAAIRASGALVSDFPLGTPPRASQFPSRNRIISGLSLGVLVVEAALRSGSLVTARLALEQNREVFALPGSIHDPASLGTNSLIRSGATLVMRAEEIVDELRGWSGPALVRSPLPCAPSAPPLSTEAATVLAAVGFEPTPFDLILQAAALPLSAVLATLGDLELRGLVENRAGSYRRCGG
jgi:DNA processing protein